MASLALHLSPSVIFQYLSFQAAARVSGNCHLSPYKVACWYQIASEAAGQLIRLPVLPRIYLAIHLPRHSDFIRRIRGNVSMGPIVQYRYVVVKRRCHRTYPGVAFTVMS